MIYQYPFVDAVNDKIVTDYCLGFAVYMRVAESKEEAQFRNIKRIARNHNRKRVIIYNQYVSASRNGKTKTSNFANQENVETISGKTPTEKRKKIFDWFQKEGDEIRFLCNVGTLKEGIDLPCVDMIVFCDDKHSRIDII